MSLTINASKLIHHFQMKRLRARTHILPSIFHDSHTVVIMFLIDGRIFSIYYLRINFFLFFLSPIFPQWSSQMNRVDSPLRMASKWGVSSVPARWTGGDGLTLLRVAIILEASSRRRNRKRLVRLRDRRHRWSYTGPAADRPVVRRSALSTRSRTHVLVSQSDPLPVITLAVAASLPYALRTAVVDLFDRIKSALPPLILYQRLGNDRTDSWFCRITRGVMPSRT